VGDYCRGKRFVTECEIYIEELPKDESSGLRNYKLERVKSAFYVMKSEKLTKFFFS
jgi:hypothetical protein